MQQTNKETKQQHNKQQEPKTTPKPTKNNQKINQKYTKMVPKSVLDAVLGASWASWGVLGPSCRQDGPKSQKYPEIQRLVSFLGSQLGSQNPPKIGTEAFQKVLLFLIGFGVGFWWHLVPTGLQHCFQNLPEIDPSWLQNPTKFDWQSKNSSFPDVVYFICLLKYFIWRINHDPWWFSSLINALLGSRCSKFSLLAQFLTSSSLRCAFKAELVNIINSVKWHNFYRLSASFFIFIERGRYYFFSSKH